MTEPKELAQRKIKQLVFLHAVHMDKQYGIKIAVNQEKEYNRIYADYQAGHITFKEILDTIKEYLELREETINE